MARSIRGSRRLNDISVTGETIVLGRRAEAFRNEATPSFVIDLLSFGSVSVAFESTQVYTPNSILLIIWHSIFNARLSIL